MYNGRVRVSVPPRIDTSLFDHGAIAPKELRDAASYNSDALIVQMKEAETSEVHEASVERFDSVCARADALARFMYARVAHKWQQPVIAPLLYNDAVVIEAHIAASLCNAIVANLNTASSANELARCLIDMSELSSTIVLLVDTRFIERVQGALSTAFAGSSQVAVYLLLLERNDRVSRLADAVPSNLVREQHWYHEALSHAPTDNTQPLPDAEDSAVFACYWTSGTTGQSKKVWLTQSMVAKHAAAAALESSINKQDVWLHAAPMFHPVDAFAIFATSWVHATQVIMPRFSSQAFLHLVERERVSITNIASTMMSMILREQSLLDVTDLSSVRVLSCGGSPLPAHDVQAAIAAFGCQFFCSYGMTETCGKIAMSLLGPKAHQNLSLDEQLKLVCSSGRPFQPLEINLLDTGEVAVRGGTVCTSAGQEWLSTGDVAFVDHLKYLHVVDRKKDMMLVGGENVFSAEVENVLCSSNLISQAAAFSLPHQLLGETVAVAIVPANYAATSRRHLENEATALVARELGEHKAPSHCFLVSALPKSASGKILKRQIREYFKALLDANASPASNELYITSKSNSAHELDVELQELTSLQNDDTALRNALTLLDANIWQYTSEKGPRYLISLDFDRLVECVDCRNDTEASVALERIVKKCDIRETHAAPQVHLQSHGAQATLQEHRICSALVACCAKKFGAELCPCCLSVVDDESEPFPTSGFGPEPHFSNTTLLVLGHDAMALAASTIPHMCWGHVFVLLVPEDDYTKDEHESTCIIHAAQAGNIASLDIAHCLDVRTAAEAAAYWNKQNYSLDHLLIFLEPQSLTGEVSCLQSVQKITSLHQSSSAVTSSEVGASVAAAYNICVVQVASSADAALARARNLPSLHSLYRTHQALYRTEWLADSDRTSRNDALFLRSRAVATSAAACATAQNRSSNEEKSAGGDKEKSVRETLRRVFADVTAEDLPSDETSQPLFNFGLSSLSAVNLTERLQQELQCDLPATLLFDYPHVPELVAQLSRLSGANTAAQNTEVPADLSQQHSSLPSSEVGIGILAISDSSPGGPNELCSNDYIKNLDLKRWDAEHVMNSRLGLSPLQAQVGGILDHVELFDCDAFRMSPAEAASADPQQRLLLLQAHKCLQQAGYEHIDNQTGVFVGISQVEHTKMEASAPDNTPFAAVGAHLSAAPGRVSYTFGFTGESCAVDTACSSALVAIHNALSSDSKQCIAGGVNLTLVPSWTAKCAHAGMLSSDGRCKALDTSADGYVRSEGAGLLLLDIDNSAAGAEIARIIATHSNQDGASSSLTSPRGPAQQELVQRAMEKASITSTEVVDVVELHATGTALGDPIELQALSQGKASSDGKLPALSAGKSSIGHSEPAAGVLGISNALSQLRHCRLAPIVHFYSVNPYIRDIKGVEGCTKTQLSPLPRKSGLAAVSGMAFQGTNAHVILSVKDSHGKRNISCDQSSRYLTKLRRFWPEPRFHSCLVSGTGVSEDVFRMSFAMASQRMHFFQDHKIANRAVLPASAALDFIADAVRRCISTQGNDFSFSLTQVSFSRMIELPDQLESAGSALEVEICLSLGKFYVLSPDRVRCIHGLISLAPSLDASKHSHTNVQVQDQPAAQAGGILARCCIRSASWLKACSTQPAVLDCAFQSLHAKQPSFLLPTKVGSFVFCSEMEGDKALLLSYAGNGVSSHTVLDEFSGKTICFASDISFRSMRSRFLEDEMQHDESAKLHLEHLNERPRASHPNILATCWSAEAPRHFDRMLTVSNPTELVKRPSLLSSTLAAMEISCSASASNKDIGLTALSADANAEELGSFLKVARRERIVSSTHHNEIKAASCVPDYICALCAPGECRISSGACFTPMTQVAQPCGKLPAAQAQSSSNGSCRNALLLGGCGGIGLTYTQSLAEEAKGCQRLVLTARNANIRVPQSILQNPYTMVTLVSCDHATSRSDLIIESVLKREFVKPPLVTAVLHGMTRDAQIKRTNPNMCREVTCSKNLGLPLAAFPIPLDSLVGFSSIVSAFGNRGQSVYACANARLDNEISFLRNHGIPAISVQFGAWNDVGMASSRQEALQEAQRAGLGTIKAPEGLQALQDASRINVSPVIVSRLSGRRDEQLQHDQEVLTDTVNSGERSDQQALSSTSHPRVDTEGTNTHLVGSASISRKNENSPHFNQILEVVQSAVVRRLGTRIEEDQPFMEAGIDSLGAMDVQNAIEEQTGQSIPPTATFDYPTPASLAKHVDSQLNGSNSTESVSSTQAMSTRAHAVDERADVRPSVPILRTSRTEPGTESAVHDMISRVKVERWDVERLFSAPPKERGARFGSFLHRVDRFDADLFRIGSSEAKQIDPQQRLLLENAAECVGPALENPENETAVYVGVSQLEYSMSWYDATAFCNSGNALSVNSGRVAFVFGLKGACASIDTACSSSLMAVHFAKESARKGSLALAGGVCLNLSERKQESFNRAGMLSPDGRCKAMDETADGYTRGEFSGFVLLGHCETHSPEAMLIGSAANQDGRSTALTAPSGPAQQKVITEALEDSNERAHAVTSFELHGTGTALGDPIEMSAATTALRPIQSSNSAYNQNVQPIAAAAGKSQTGHSEPAAGIAGLVRGCLIKLQYRLRSPILHLRQVSSHIESSCAKGGLVPTRERAPRPSMQPQEVGAVTSFAFQGSNCHLLVKRDTRSEHQVATSPRLNTMRRSRHSMVAPRFAMLLSVSAASNQSIRFVVDTSVVNSALQDHIIAGSTIMPATGMLEVFFECLKTMDAPQQAAIGNCTFSRPVYLSNRVEVELSVGTGNMELWANGSVCARGTAFIAPLVSSDSTSRSPAAAAFADLVSTKDKEPIACGSPLHESTSESFALGPGPAACDNLLQLGTVLSGDCIEMRVPTSVDVVTPSTNVYGSSLMGAVRVHTIGTSRSVGDHMLIHGPSGGATRMIGLETRNVGQPRKSKTAAAESDAFLYYQLWQAEPAHLSGSLSERDSVLVQQSRAAETALASASLLQGSPAFRVITESSYHDPIEGVSKAHAAESAATKVKNRGMNYPMQLQQHSRKSVDEAASAWCIRTNPRFTVLRLQSTFVRQSSGLRNKRKCNMKLMKFAHLTGYLEAAPMDAKVRATGAAVVALGFVMRDGRRGAADPELVAEVPHACCDGKGAALLEPTCDALLACKAVGEPARNGSSIAILCRLTEGCNRARVLREVLHMQTNWITKIINAQHLPENASAVIVCCHQESIESRLSNLQARIVTMISHEQQNLASISASSSQIISGICSANASKSALSIVMKEAGRILPWIKAITLSNPLPVTAVDEMPRNNVAAMQELCLRIGSYDTKKRLAIITGGTGTLGLLVALWESARGSDIVLQSRSGRIDNNASEMFTKLLNSNVRVSIVRSDISRSVDWNVLEERIRGYQYLYGSIIVHHAAGVLKDGFLSGQSHSSFRQVVSPKARGAINMDTFVSSLAPVEGYLAYATAGTVVGNAGQSNYAAANNSLERYCITSRSQGIPALAMQWAAWIGGGMANENAIRLLRKAGWEIILPERGLAVIEGVLKGLVGARSRSALSTMLEAPVDWHTFVRQVNHVPDSLAAVVKGSVRDTEGEKKPQTIQEQSQEIDEGKHSKRQLRENQPTKAGRPRKENNQKKESSKKQDGYQDAQSKAVRKEVGSSSIQNDGRMSHNEIKSLIQNEVNNAAGRSVGDDEILTESGIDSLAASELRDNLASRFDMELDPTFAFDYPTIGALADFFAEQQAQQVPTASTTMIIDEASSDEEQSHDYEDHMEIDQGDDASDSSSSGIEEIEYVSHEMQHSGDSVQHSTVAVDGSVAMSRDELFKTVKSLVDDAAGRDVDPTENLMETGLDSLQATELRDDLVKRSGVELDPTFAFDLPDMNALVDYLYQQQPQSEMNQVQEPSSQPVRHDETNEGMLDEETKRNENKTKTSKEKKKKKSSRSQLTEWSRTSTGKRTQGSEIQHGEGKRQDGAGSANVEFSLSRIAKGDDIHAPILYVAPTFPSASAQYPPLVNSLSPAGRAYFAERTSIARTSAQSVQDLARWHAYDMASERKEFFTAGDSIGGTLAAEIGAEYEHKQNGRLTGVLLYDSHLPQTFPVEAVPHDRSYGDFLTGTLSQYFSNDLDSETQDILMTNAVQRLGGVDPKVYSTKDTPGWRRFLQSVWLQHFSLCFGDQRDGCSREESIASYRTFAPQERGKFTPLQAPMLLFRTRGGYGQQILASFSRRATQQPSVAHLTSDGLVLLAHPTAWSAYVPTLELVDTICDHSSFNEQADTLVSPKSWELLSAEWGSPSDDVASRFTPVLSADEHCTMALSDYWCEERIDKIWTNALPLQLHVKIAEEVAGVDAAGASDEKNTTSKLVRMLDCKTGWIVALNENFPRPERSLPLACFVVHNQTEEFPVWLSKVTRQDGPLFGVHVSANDRQEEENVSASVAAAIRAFLKRAASNCSVVILACSEYEGVAANAASCLHAMEGGRNHVVAARLQVPLGRKQTHQKATGELVMDQLNGFQRELYGCHIGSASPEHAQQAYWMERALSAAKRTVFEHCEPIIFQAEWITDGSNTTERVLYYVKQQAGVEPASESNFEEHALQEQQQYRLQQQSRRSNPLRSCFCGFPSN